MQLFFSEAYSWWVELIAKKTMSGVRRLTIGFSKF